MHTPSSNGHLERKLKNRHIQLIALGGTIGTGLFLGSAGIIELAGPGVLLGYAIGGLLIIIGGMAPILFDWMSRKRTPVEVLPER